MDWNPKTPAAALWDWPDTPAFAASPSASASIDSSPYAAVTTPPPPTQDPPLGLKLGKRTYFEDICPGTSSGGGGGSGGTNCHVSSSASSLLSAAAPKRSRVSSSHHTTQVILRCQVEGCAADLTGAKDYHRKHRVCESHSKSSLVVVAGQRRRFCQQCSRFHDPAAFDDKKRSCRKRLADHNARRRKPQQATISFNSAGISLPYYDDRHQTNLLFSGAPFGHLRPSTSWTWEGSCDFRISHVKGSWLKSTKGEMEGEVLPSTDLPNPFSTPSRDLDMLLPFKLTNSEFLTQGPQASVAASSLHGAPDLRRAHSLLSSDSWGSAEPGPPSVAQQVPTNQTNVAHHAIRYYQNEQPLAQQKRVLPFAMQSNSSHFQEFHQLKASYEGTFVD